MKKFRVWGFGVVGVDAVLGGGFALWGGRMQFWVEDLALWGRTQFWAGASPCKRDNIPVN